MHWQFFVVRRRLTSELQRMPITQIINQTLTDSITPIRVRSAFEFLQLINSNLRFNQHNFSTLRVLLQ